MSEPKSILVVRRDNIGDLVCTLPLIAALRKRYPRAWIGVYANSYNAPIVSGHPDIDEVLVYRKAKHHRDASRFAIYTERAAQVLALRRKRLDWVVLATPAHQPRLLRLARLFGSKQIAGFVEHAHRKHGLSYVVALESTQGSHEVETVFRLARAFGIEGHPPPLQLTVDAAERERVIEALGAAGLSNANPIVGIHISARKPRQRWPTYRFVELMRTLHKQEGVTFILFWSAGPSDHPQHPGDDDKAREVISQLGSSLPVLAWNTTTLPALVAGLSVCGSVVCSDGGAMHVAAALGKRIVCLFGQSDAERWRPWGAPHRVLQAVSREVSDVSVAAVATAWRELVPRQAVTAQESSLPSALLSGL